jgi:hypothetical protein
VAKLTFDCLGAHVEPYAAMPTLGFRVRIAEQTGEVVHAIVLRCQIRIEPSRRRYSELEAQRLHDLFGDVSRFADTLKPIQFASVAAMVPGFTGELETDLPVPCSYDLEIAAARYFYGLADGDIPLLLLFSGTVFLKRESGFAVEQVPWSAESSYRMPVATWRQLVDQYFPNSGWLRCTRDTLDALALFKTEHALPTWESTLIELLARATEERS